MMFRNENFLKKKYFFFNFSRPERRISGWAMMHNDPTPRLHHCMSCTVHFEVTATFWGRTPWIWSRGRSRPIRQNLKRKRGDEFEPNLMQIFWKGTVWQNLAARWTWPKKRNIDKINRSYKYRISILFTLGVIIFIQPHRGNYFYSTYY